MFNIQENCVKWVSKVIKGDGGGKTKQKRIPKNKKKKLILSTYLADSTFTTRIKQYNSLNKFQR